MNDQLADAENDGVNPYAINQQAQRAQVAREQTTVYADTGVSGITDELIEEAAKALIAGSGSVHEVRVSDPKVAWWVVEQVLSAVVLAGRVVVDQPQPATLPFDARDRIERTLRVYEGHTIPEVAHRIMLALTRQSSGVAGGGSR